MSLPTQPGTSQANVSIPPPDVPSSLLTPALTPRTPRARSSSSSPLREPTSSVPAPFKIPPFWTENPRLYFKYIESAFTRSHIYSESRRFDELLIVLNSSIVNQISHEIINIGTNRPYTKLKDLLIEKFSPSRDTRLGALLRPSELGDVLPSELVKHLFSLVGYENKDDPFAISIIRKIFFDKMPDHVRQILASHDDESLVALGARGDRIISNSQNLSKNDSNFVQDSIKNKIFESKLSELAASVEKLTENVQNMTLDSRSRTQQRWNGNYRPRHDDGPFRPSRFGPRPHYNKTPYYDNSRNKDVSFNNNSEPSSSNMSWRNSGPNYNVGPICSYHARFGNRARNCVKPCNFAPNEYAARR